MARNAKEICFYFIFVFVSILFSFACSSASLLFFDFHFDFDFISIHSCICIFDLARFVALFNRLAELLGPHGVCALLLPI